MIFDTSFTLKDRQFRKVCGVYALVDPDEKRIMLIDKSVDISKSARLHEFGKSQNPISKQFHKYISKLQSEGKSLIVSVLCECEPIDLERREKEFIRKYKKNGECEFNYYPQYNGCKDEWRELLITLNETERISQEAAQAALRLCGTRIGDNFLSRLRSLAPLKADVFAAIIQKFGSSKEFDEFR